MPNRNIFPVQVSFGLHVTFLLCLIRQVMYRQMTVPSASNRYRKARPRLRIFFIEKLHVLLIYNLHQQGIIPKQKNLELIVYTSCYVDTLDR